MADDPGIRPHGGIRMKVIMTGDQPRVIFSDSDGSPRLPGDPLSSRRRTQSDTTHTSTSSGTGGRVKGAHALVMRIPKRDTIRQNLIGGMRVSLSIKNIKKMVRHCPTFEQYNATRKYIDETLAKYARKCNPVKGPYVKNIFKYVYRRLSGCKRKILNNFTFIEFFDDLSEECDHIFIFQMHLGSKKEEMKLIGHMTFGKSVPYVVAVNIFFIQLSRTWCTITNKFLPCLISSDNLCRNTLPREVMIGTTLRCERDLMNAIYRLPKDKRERPEVRQNFFKSIKSHHICGKLLKTAKIGSRFTTYVQRRKLFYRKCHKRKKKRLMRLCRVRKLQALVSPGYLENPAKSCVNHFLNKFGVPRGFPKMEKCGDAMLEAMYKYDFSGYRNIRGMRNYFFKIKNLFLKDETIVMNTLPPIKMTPTEDIDKKVFSGWRPQPREHLSYERSLGDRRLRDTHTEKLFSIGDSISVAQTSPEKRVFSATTEIICADSRRKRNKSFRSFSGKGNSSWSPSAAPPRRARQDNSSSSMNNSPPIDPTRVSDLPSTSYRTLSCERSAIPTSDFEPVVRSDSYPLIRNDQLVDCQSVEMESVSSQSCMDLDIADTDGTTIKNDQVFVEQDYSANMVSYPCVRGDDPSKNHTQSRQPEQDANGVSPKIEESKKKANPKFSIGKSPCFSAPLTRKNKEKEVTSNIDRLCASVQAFGINQSSSVNHLKEALSLLNSDSFRQFSKKTIKGSKHMNNVVSKFKFHHSTKHKGDEADSDQEAGTQYEGNGGAEMETVNDLNAQKTSGRMRSKIFIETATLGSAVHPANKKKDMEFKNNGESDALDGEPSTNYKDPECFNRVRDDNNQKSDVHIVVLDAINGEPDSHNREIGSNYGNHGCNFGERDLIIRIDDDNEDQDDDLSNLSTESIDDEEFSDGFAEWLRKSEKTPLQEKHLAELAESLANVERDFYSNLRHLHFPLSPTSMDENFEEVTDPSDVFDPVSSPPVSISLETSSNVPNVIQTGTENVEHLPNFIMPSTSQSLGVQTNSAASTSNFVLPSFDRSSLNSFSDPSGISSFLDPSLIPPALFYGSLAGLPLQSSSQYPSDQPSTSRDYSMYATLPAPFDSRVAELFATHNLLASLSGLPLAPQLFPPQPLPCSSDPLPISNHQAPPPPTPALPQPSTSTQQLSMDRPPSPSSGIVKPIPKKITDFLTGKNCSSLPSSFYDTFFADLPSTSAEVTTSNAVPDLSTRTPIKNVLSPAHILRKCLETMVLNCLANPTSILSSSLSTQSALAAPPSTSSSNILPLSTAMVPSTAESAGTSITTNFNDFSTLSSFWYYLSNLQSGNLQYPNMPISTISDQSLNSAWPNATSSLQAPEQLDSTLAFSFSSSVLNSAISTMLPSSSFTAPGNPAALLGAPSISIPIPPTATNTASATPTSSASTPAARHPILSGLLNSGPKRLSDVPPEDVAISTSAVTPVPSASATFSVPISPVTVAAPSPLSDNSLSLIPLILPQDDFSIAEALHYLNQLFVYHHWSLSNVSELSNEVRRTVWSSQVLDLRFSLPDVDDSYDTVLVHQLFSLMVNIIASRNQNQEFIPFTESARPMTQEVNTGIHAPGVLSLNDSYRPISSLVSTIAMRDTAAGHALMVSTRNVLSIMSVLNNRQSSLPFRLAVFLPFNLTAAAKCLKTNIKLFPPADRDDPSSSQ